MVRSSEAYQTGIAPCNTAPLTRARHSPQNCDGNLNLCGGLLKQIFLVSQRKRIGPLHLEQTLLYEFSHESTTDFCLANCIVSALRRLTAQGPPIPTENV